MRGRVYQGGALTRKSERRMRAENYACQARAKGSLTRAHIIGVLTLELAIVVCKRSEM